MSIQQWLSLAFLLAGVAAMVHLLLLGWKKLQQSIVEKRVRSLITTLPGKATPWEGKRALVMVNPIGGNRDGRWMYKSVVSPLLSAAGARVVLIETERQGHAYDIIQQYDESVYDAVVVIGGDGLLFEVINALCQRCLSLAYKELDVPASLDSQLLSPSVIYAMKEKMSRIPLAIVPGGTNNGVSVSLGGRDVVSAVYNIATCAPQEVHLVEVVRPAGERLWDCMHVSWALVSQHDLLQERKLRWMGSARNIIAPLMVIFAGKSSKGRVSFLPASHTFTNTQAGAGSPSLSSSSFASSSSSSSVIIPKGYRDPATVPPHPTLSEWRQIKGGFFVCSAVAVPDVGTDIKMSKDLRPNVGAVDLLIVRSNISRLQVLNFFRLLDNAAFVDLPYIELYRVSEYRFEPDEESSSSSSSSPSSSAQRYLSLSGELYPETELQGRVHKGMLKFFYKAEI